MILLHEWDYFSIFYVDLILYVEIFIEIKYV
jgi:hypothetical protein